MATFSDRVTPWNASDYSCSGRGIYADVPVYHVAVMQFSISSLETKQASNDRQRQEDSIKPSKGAKLFRIWENYVTRYALFVYYEVFAEVMSLNITKALLVMPQKKQYVFRLALCASSLISHVERMFFDFK